MKKILLFLSLSLLVLNVSGQVLFDENSGGLINGEEWYSFGNPEFDFEYYPVAAFAADPSQDIQENGYFGIGNAHYAGGEEAPFGLSGAPENNFIRVTFSAGSNLDPTSLEVRLRTMDEELFTAYLYKDGKPGFVEQTVVLPLSDFFRVGNPAQKPTAGDIADFSTLQFMFGFHIMDTDAGFTIHKAELLKAKTIGTVIYDGSTTALVNGEKWYSYGNKDTEITEHHPLTIQKTDNTLDYNPEDDQYYFGVGNARYGDDGAESFGLKGNTASDFFEVNFLLYTYAESRLDIRFKGEGGTEFTYRLLDWGFHGEIEEVTNSELKTIRFPLSQLVRLEDWKTPITASELEGLYEVGFNLRLAAVDSDPLNDFDVFLNVNSIEFYNVDYCSFPTAPELSTELVRGCFGTQETINLTGGELNDAEDWFWYKDECGGELLGKGSSMDITINGPATLYVRGEGAGECAVVGPCASVRVEMIPMTTDDEVVEISGDNHTECVGDIFNFEATSNYHNEESLYQWYLNDEPYGELSSDNTVSFEGLEKGDRIYVKKKSQQVCTDVEFVSSLELTVTCSPITSFMRETLGITSAYVAGDRLVMKVNVAEQSGDVQVMNATGVILGQAANVNLNETITLPVVSEDGLIIINLITDKGVYNQKLMVR